MEKTKYSQHKRGAKKYQCQDIWLAYNDNGVIGAFVINEHGDKIKDLASNSIVNIENWITNELPQQKQDYLMHELWGSPKRTASSKANLNIAVNLLYSNLDISIDNSNVEEMPIIYISSLPEMAYNFTSHDKIPGIALKDVKAEIARQRYLTDDVRFPDETAKRNAILGPYFCEKIVSYGDIFPLLREISSNMRKNRKYGELAKKEAATAQEEQQEASENLDF